MRSEMWFRGAVFALFFALAAKIATALEINPEALVQSATNKVIAAIRKDGVAHDPEKLARLVDTTILPNFDFAYMTRLVMGRNWWLASHVQQQALIAEFETLLVRTYSSSLSLYRDETIEFDPLRVKPGDTVATVRSWVKKPGADTVNIDFSMEREPSGWKVYNVSIDGISLVLNYRDTFESQVNKQGVDGLIKMLADKNGVNSTR